jgi:hypothetical protein
MKILKKFIVAHVLWSSAIMVLLVPISIITADAIAPAGYLRWLGHSVALATFPAGLMVGGDAFRGRVWHNIALLSLVELVLMVFVLAMLGFVAPMDKGNIIAELQHTRVIRDWLTWNQHAWSVYMTAAEVLSVPIYAGLGLMLGAWGEQVLPPAFRRILFWAVSLLMVGLTYLITENSYEMLVIKTNGPAAFSAFFMLLIPAGMYLGLVLPSVGLAKRGRVL